MPSVKEIRVDDPPDGGPGSGRFYFTDDYSVFDWGRMPDTIPGKGASLCTMGAHTFESLAAAGVRTHYRGVIDDGEVVSVDDATDPPREMAVDLVTVPNLPYDGQRYDYEAFHAAAGDYYLVPLEVVFRNVVPPGSSLRRRTDPADHGLDAEEWPAETVELDEPVVEFSTKFEESDRYLDREEAARIAGRADLDAVERVARTVNRVVTERAREAGFQHQDGKIEVAYVAGGADGGGESADATDGADSEILVADVAGTFDENRFAFDGQQVSKEVVRQYYRREHPAWVEAVEDAKREAKARGDPDWKALCDRDPAPLPEHVVSAVSDLYRAGANAYVGRELFDAPDVADAVATAREL
jgi:phosphoribosylaminoimidazole-succinocarboxamide synthase